MTLAVLVALSLALRAADHWYYRDAAPVLRALHLAPRDGGPASLHRPLDPAFAVVPFVWGWTDVAAGVLLAAEVGGLAWPLLAVLAGTRFRHLQEVSHTAVHAGLCRSRRWQWALSEVLCNAPLVRPDMPHRYQAHVREHHWNVNDPDLDPNVRRFVRVGFVPGLSRAAFHRKLLHPLSPRGLAETVTMTATNAARNTRAPYVALRAAAMAAVVAALLAAGGVPALAWAYVVPMLTTYPLLSWVSLLAEHRWFVASDAADRWTRECLAGRPTAYPGVVGALLSRAVSPCSDRYHLAHSLFPSLRWNHLPAVDAALRAAPDERYARYASEGLLLARGGAPAALSELRDRMTLARDDLAPWAAALVPSPTALPAPVPAR